MSPQDELESDDPQAGEGGVDVAEESKPKLDLQVVIEEKSACQRHITVCIPRQDIDRYYSKAFNELMPTADVPGFRVGRAPRKLVETRFRKNVTDQVKGSLVMDCLEQISEANDLSPISEPDLDLVAIVVPDEGPMTFEFNIEVRPQFDLPDWKGLSIERPNRQFTDEDVDAQLQVLLEDRGRLVPCDRAAKAGDFITANLCCKHDGQKVAGAAEQTICIRPVLSFRDGKIENFDKLMEGVQGGETRVGKTKLTPDAPNEQLRNETIEVEFEVLEVKQLELPELTAELLDQLGDFEDEADLKNAVRESLQRRLSYDQQRQARRQILSQLTVTADWDLPPDLLKRQTRREFERSVMELRRSGFSDAEVRAHANELSQNSQESTARSLKEHFILERIAEEQEIEASERDYELEIALIAQQSGDSPRRVRAQLNKRNMMDALRNQIIERKVIELILNKAKFRDVPYQLETRRTEAIELAAGGGVIVEQEIPEAKYTGEAKPLSNPPERD